MSRIAVVGPAREEIFLIDRDDFVETIVGDQSVFGKIAIGSNIDIDKALFTIGGSGANAAVSLARHGHQVIYLGELGKDAAGEAVLRCFDEENVDSSYIEFTDNSTSCSVVLLDAKTRERTTLAYTGNKKPKVPADDLDLIQPDWLYLGSMNGNFANLEALVKKAHALGAQVFFTPGPAELSQKSKFTKFLTHVDALALNKSEAASIVPGVVLTELLSRLGNYCQTVLITDGIMGAVAKSGPEAYRLGVYEQVNFVDRSGVGDAFAAGFLAAYAADQDFMSALTFAAANATKVTTHYGAHQGVLTGSEKLHAMPVTKIQDLKIED